MKRSTQYVSLFPALAGLALVVVLLTLFSAGTVYADKPPGYDPPRIDGLLDESYVYAGPTGVTHTPGKLYYYYDDEDDDGSHDTCYYALVVDPGFNDNVFGRPPYTGTVLAGWNGDHFFWSLHKSDHAQFEGAIPDCAISYDYIEAVPAADPQEWCSGLCGIANEGALVGTGCAGAAERLEFASSLEYNAVQSEWFSVTNDYLASNFEKVESKNWNSPRLDYNCIEDDYYEFQMIYEFSLSNPAGGTCGNLVVANSHNSPSKEEGHEGELARIGNYVWYDENRDGMQNETGAGTAMDGVCLSLYQAGPDQVSGTEDDLRVGMTLTDRDGIYWFNYLQPGTYYVDPGGVCIPDGYCHSLNLDEVDNDNGSLPDPAGDDPPLCPAGLSMAMGGPTDPFEITVAAGETYPKADFGYDDAPTALHLESLTATPGEGAIEIAWSTSSEGGNLGFNLFRAGAEGVAAAQLNANLIPSALPPGSPLGASYAWRDEGAVRGTAYSYWLEAVSVSGEMSVLGPVEAALGEEYTGPDTTAPVPETAPEAAAPPPVVPEASTLLLLASGASGLAGYVGLQVRARRRKR